MHIIWEILCLYRVFELYFEGVNCQQKECVVTGNMVLPESNDLADNLAVEE